MSDLVVPNFKQPKKPKPQKSRQNYSAQCDMYAGRIARSRGFCDNCLSRGDLQWAHGFSRRYRNTRWLDEANFCLCRSCHLYFTFRPLEWDDWLRNRWGDELYNEFRALAVSDDKAHKPNVRSLAAQLKARWEAIERRIGEAS